MHPSRGLRPDQDPQRCRPGAGVAAKGFSVSFCSVILWALHLVMFLLKFNLASLPVLYWNRIFFCFSFSVDSFSLLFFSYCPRHVFKSQCLLVHHDCVSRFDLLLQFMLIFWISCYFGNTQEIKLFFLCIWTTTQFPDLFKSPTEGTFWPFNNTAEFH